MIKKYRTNRAVGILNDGDEFTMEETDHMVVSLLGAGYIDEIWNSAEVGTPTIVQEEQLELFDEQVDTEQARDST